MSSETIEAVASALSDVLEDYGYEIARPLTVGQVIDAVYRAGKTLEVQRLTENADAWGAAIFVELEQHR